MEYIYKYTPLYVYVYYRIRNRGRRRGVTYKGLKKGTAALGCSRNWLHVYVSPKMEGLLFCNQMGRTNMELLVPRRSLQLSCFGP